MGKAGLAMPTGCPVHDASRVPVREAAVALQYRVNPFQLQQFVLIFLMFDAQDVRSMMVRTTLMRIVPNQGEMPQWNAP